MLFVGVAVVVLSFFVVCCPSEGLSSAKIGIAKQTSPREREAADCCTQFARGTADPTLRCASGELGPLQDERGQPAYLL